MLRDHLILLVKELLPEPLQELGRGQCVQTKNPACKREWPKAYHCSRQMPQNLILKFQKMRMTGKQSYPLTSCSLEPKSLDDVLSRHNAKEWQMALDYEIGQLQKLSTWVIEDLPKGHTAIPCSTVLKIGRAHV